MRIYMLNPPFVPRFSRSMRWQERARGGTIYYPIWLAYATGLLEKEGHNVRLVDAPAQNLSLYSVLRDIKKFAPDMVVIETSFTSLHNDMLIVRKIKQEFPDIITVVVGPPTSQFADKILKLGADIVARYEYDWTLSELAYTLEKQENLKKVLGISYKQRSNSHIEIKHNPNRPFSTQNDLDSLPFVTWVYKRHLNIYDYYLSSALYPEVQIFSGRGCPFRCTFCAWPQTFMGRKVRLRSVENVIRELYYIKAELPFVKEVVFEDDTFGVNRKWLHKFCLRLIQEKLDVTWSCQVRADLDYETLQLMSRAGCRLVIVGFESANQHILNAIKKGISLKQMEKFANNVRKAGILLHADFIFGLPKETPETIAQTIRFIFKIRPEVLQISIATPFPGTEFYEWLKRKGYLITENLSEYLDEFGHQRAIISYPSLSAEEIERWIDKALKMYYFSPFFITAIFRQIARKNGLEELRRILRAFLSFILYLLERKLAHFKSENHYENKKKKRIKRHSVPTTIY